MITDKQIQKKLRNLPRLPILREVGNMLSNFLEINMEGSSDIERELLFIISRDPALVFNTLKMANSAYYALPRKIKSVKEAINIIGFSDLREFVLEPLLKDYLSSPSYYDWKLFWFHSIATAIMADYIGEFLGYELREELFTAALIHDIGKLVEYLSYPDFFQSTVISAGEKWEPFFEIERELSGVDHAFLGGFLARMWRFPYEYIKSIELHHENKIPEEFHGQDTRVISVVVMISNEIVKYYGISTPGASFYVLNKNLFDFLALPREFIERHAFKVRREAMFSLERLGLSFF